MTIKVTNQQILTFIVNANQVVQNLTAKGKRTRYTSVLQFQKDHFESNYNAIQKKIQRLREQYASVNERGEFIYDAGNNMTYTRENMQKLDDALTAFLDEEKQLEVDEVYFLTEKDLPKNDEGEISLSNQTLKCFCGFVISKDLCDQLIYKDLKVA